MNINNNKGKRGKLKEETSRLQKKILASYSRIQKWFHRYLLPDYVGKAILAILYKH